jgi:hypothetical protein
MKRFIHIPAGMAAAAALTMAAGLAQAATPQADTTLPPVQTSGPIEYLSGGIGQGEAQAIEQASRHWPLTLEFAQHRTPRDEYVADVDTVVRDQAGRKVLDIVSDGPFVLAKLPPGSYSIAATMDGKTLHEKVVIKQGEPAKAVFVWPAGTDNQGS